MNFSHNHMHTLLSLTIILLSSAFTSASSTQQVSVRELPLPEVPESMTDPMERADYIISHFWDKMNFSDTVMSHDNDFIEQNFVNYINLFSHANPHNLPGSVKKLMDSAEADSFSAKLIYSLADKYLLTKDSPFRNENHHILFLENAVRSEALGEAGRLRAGYRLEAESKNLPGSQANDFRFITRDGNGSSLYSTSFSKCILLFYDPDCDHCGETISTLREIDLPDELSIMAIDAEDDRHLWEESCRSLPENWIVGYATDPIQDEETYIFEEMPTIFLLDANKNILLKDASVSEIKKYISHPDKK